MATATSAGPSRRATRDVSVLAATIGGLSLGEELWQAYVPAYLAALGAAGLGVGAFASVRELLDSLYQVPGGWLTDRVGYRRALMMFTGLATLGYVIYAVSPSWPVMLLGLAAVMSWKAGAFPLTFAVVGDALPPERRATAFAVQSILVRLPRVISAPIGGVVITALGVVFGFRVLCGVTVVIALLVMFLQRYTVIDPTAVPRGGFTAGRGALAPHLRGLLLAECLVRFGEGIAASFVVLYVTQVTGRTMLEFGTLYAIQQSVAIASYLPGARLTAWTGRRSVVASTFLFFSLFPLAVRIASTYTGLVAAFVVGGLKEIGEPARKALIVDLTSDGLRASQVGRYYAIRNAVVVPAGIAGGLLWQHAPHLPLLVASVVSLAGLIVFIRSEGAGAFADHRSIDTR